MRKTPTRSLRVSPEHMRRTNREVLQTFLDPSSHKASPGRLSFSLACPPELQRSDGWETNGKSHFLAILLLFMPCISFAWFFNTPVEKPFVLLLEASGDSMHPGRSIDDSFESTITFEIAQTIKQLLLAQCPHVKVLLNRTATETVTPLQNANFANRLDVDCYMSIHAFLETETKPHVYLYQFSYRDDFIAKDSGLSFYPFDKIYMVNQKQTTAWAQQLKQAFEKNAFWAVKGVYSIPFKPLIGIKAPAIGIEIGLKNKSEWHNYGETIVNGIVGFINSR